jgi:hypothetical protein
VIPRSSSSPAPPAASVISLPGPSPAQGTPCTPGCATAGRNAAEVADEIARVVNLPVGQRPFRTHIDPSRDGSEVVSAVSDRIRAEFYHRVGIAELLPAQATL